MGFLFMALTVVSGLVAGLVRVMKRGAVQGLLLLSAKKRKEVSVFSRPDTTFSGESGTLREETFTAEL